MKTSLLKLFIAVLLALPAMSNAQTPGNPVIYKDWEMIVESLTLIDVSYRSIKCVSTNQVHLMIFNENSKPQKALFDLEITDVATGEKFTKEINFDCATATVYKALCESETALDPLKINLPTNFNPSAITVKVTFK
ncbi:MAG: hypothetical protein FD136_97 [Chitinophagaceae bacterium]|nr:MAG: hypothetical protein FD183_267 [Chitinophagaceae bacterium]TXT34795.1 MAG: hypothetical protein FD136_97 [Chitinophagaceae bacterium]